MTLEDDIHRTVSYIIPAYNMEKYIRQCINSIFFQSYPDSKLEIVVVNDGSTDDTLERIQDVFDDRFGKTHDNVENYQIIDLKENKGPGYALNVGFKSASGEYLCFLSADDLLLNRFKTILQIAYMDVHKYDLSYFNHFMMGTDNEKNIIRGSFLFGLQNDIILKNNYLLYLMLNLKNPINSSSIMIKRESYFKYGEWDPILRADCDANLLLKYALHGAKIGEISSMKDPIFYRIHPGQVSNQKKLMNDSIRNNRLKYKEEVLSGEYPLWLKLAVRGLI